MTRLDFPDTQNADESKFADRTIARRHCIGRRRDMVIFDFTRFGLRVPAVLVSPLIAAGTVFRATVGRIDHTSVLKTISERSQTDPLTQRDQAAASLGDVLTLDEPRASDDDPLKGVAAPVSSTPSKRVDALQARQTPRRTRRCPAAAQRAGLL